MPDFLQTHKIGHGQAPHTTVQKSEAVQPSAPEIELSSALEGLQDPHRLTPAQVLNLQRTIGNAAVQRLLSGSLSSSEPPTVVQRQQTDGDELVQRRLFNNVPAKFQTQNNKGAPNSEYIVTETGYRRYAPINLERGRGIMRWLRSLPVEDRVLVQAKARAQAQSFLNQVYFDSSNRSFLYTRSEKDALDAKKKTYAQLQEGGTTALLSNAPDDPKKIVAQLQPANGLNVFDFDEADGVMSHRHPGHPVTGLGDDLPALDDPEKLLDRLMVLSLTMFHNEST